MIEATIIAIVFIIAIELNCKDLFNVKHSNQTIIKPVQSANSMLHSRISDSDMANCESVSILRRRKCEGEATKEADAASVEDMQ